MNPLKRVVLVGVGILILSAAGSSNPGPAAKSKPRCIDTHNHLFGMMPRGRKVVKDFDGAAKVAIEAMDKLGIEKMLILPPPFEGDHPGRYDAKELAAIVKKYPKRLAFLAGGGSLNPMIQQALKEGKTSEALKKKFRATAEAILKSGALGFGEMTAEHLSLGPKHLHQQAPPDHPLFLLLAEIAAKHDVPIDLHMEAIVKDMPRPKELSDRNPARLTPNIARLEKLLEHNRKA